MSPGPEYFAALFDSSGMMCIVSQKKSGTRSPVLEIRRAEPELIQFVAEFFDVSVQYYKPKSLNSGWYYCKITGHKCQSALRYIRPYMQVRGADADRLLAVELAPRGGDWRRRREHKAARLGAELQRLAA